MDYVWLFNVQCNGVGIDDHQQTETRILFMQMQKENYSANVSPVHKTKIF